MHVITGAMCSRVRHSHEDRRVVFHICLFPLLFCDVPWILTEWDTDHSSITVLPTLDSYKSLQLPLTTAERSFLTKLNRAVIYRHKCNYLEGHSLGMLHLFRDTIAVVTSVGPMISAVTGFWLDLWYET